MQRCGSILVVNIYVGSILDEKAGYFHEILTRRIVQRDLTVGISKSVYYEN